LPDERLSVRDAADRLGVPDTTVRLLLTRGELAGGELPAEPGQRRLSPTLWVSARAVTRLLRQRDELRHLHLAVTVGALKGGVGKSTVTWVLATLLAHEGGQVLVVDADPNSQTLFTWANRAIAAGHAVPFRVFPWATNDLLAGVRPMLADCDHVLIDTGPDGRDLTLFQAACRLAPLLVMPFAPRDVELGRLPATLEAARRGSALTERPVWPVVLLNKITVRGGASEQARADLAADRYLADVPVLDGEVRDLSVFARFGAPLTPDQCGDFAGVLAELRQLTDQITKETS